MAEEVDYFRCWAPWSAIGKVCRTKECLANRVKTLTQWLSLIVVEELVPGLT
jgi:hypothetical protein